MSKLHEKKISELDGGELWYCGEPITNGVSFDDLKQWAIAVVKEHSRLKELTQKKKNQYRDVPYINENLPQFHGRTSEEAYQECRAVMIFLRERFEITKEDLK